jgi:type III secretory pathway lipoprotein EscJ
MASVLSGCTEKTVEVLRSKDQRDANAAVHWLERYGGHPSVEKAGDAREPIYVVTVPPGEHNGARALLHQLALPAPLNVTNDTGGLLPGPDDSLQKAIRLRQRELESAIEMDPQVVSAIVNLVLPPVRSGTRRNETIVPQASVMVAYIGENTPSALEATVRTIVAHGVEGIANPETVSVSLVRVEPIPIADGSTASTDFDELQKLRLQRTTFGAASLVLLLGFAALLVSYLRGLGLRK